MSNDNKLRKNMVKTMIQNQLITERKYKDNNPNTLLILFEKELKKLGYEFESLSQVVGFLPEHKNQIIPIAKKMYKNTKIEHDKRYFLSLFHFKGMDECIPLMLNDIYSNNVSFAIKATITENLRVIRSKKHIDDYLRILAMKELADARNPIIALLGDLKVEQAIPMLISSLDEGKNITTNALAALGKFRKDELKVYFEKYVNHQNMYYRREAKRALEKLN